MSFAKKLIAGITSIIIAATATSCGSGSTWIATYDNEKIPAGIYIWYEIAAFNEALTTLQETDETITAVKESDVIEETPAYEWIRSEALASVREFVAVNEKFDELGMTLSDEDIENAESSIEYYWDTYYKDTCGANGISYDSMLAIVYNSYKRGNLLPAYYSTYDVVENGETVTKDGLQKLDEQAVLDYYVENNARVKMIEVQLKDGSGTALTEDKDISAERARAEQYLTRLKNGDSIDDLIVEYKAYYEKLQADASSAEADSTTVTTAAETTPAETTTTTGANPTPGVPETTTAPVVTTVADATTTSDAATTTTVTSETSADTTTTADTTTAATTTTAGETTTASAAEGDDAENETLYPNETIIAKDSTTPSEEVVTKVFEMDYDTPIIVETASVIYVIERLDINERKEDLFDEQYDNILSTMKQDDFNKEIEALGDAIELVLNQDAYDRYLPEKLELNEA